ncbi:MAG: hypothetical protein QNK03_06795, partial [Myxococcota bacterium]|nr:hypothetical protein [Myxococcota bacterium]
MHSAIPLLLAFGTAVATTMPAPPAAAQSGPLGDCRTLLLRFVDDSCGPQNQCPQPDVVAADDACRQAVENDPTDGEARLFRAYTRLMRLAEEDHTGPDFRTSLQGVLDRFAFTTDPNARQYGLTADGRSLLDFTATPPQPAVGRTDGSISDRDPFRGTYLEAGGYWLAISPRDSSVDEVAGQAARWAATYTVIGNEIDGYQRAISDHGDYRIQVIGDVSISNFEGSLAYDPESESVPMDVFRLDVLSDGEVAFDVLSWEQDDDPPSGGHTGRPIDVNGDGEIAFFDAELFLVRGEESLSWSRLVFSAAASTARPIDLPEDSPTGDDIQHSLETAWLPAIEESLAHLAAITDKTIEVSIPPNSAPLLAPEDEPGGPPADREVDYGDVKLFEAVLHAARATILLATALDLELDLDSYTPLVAALRFQQEVIDANGPLLTFLPGAAAPLAESNAANGAAIDAFLAASRFMRAETDDQANDFFVLDPRGRRREVQLRTELAALRRSVVAPASLLCSRTLWTAARLEELEQVVGTQVDGHHGVLVDLNALYGQTAVPVRDLIPEIHYDLATEDNSLRAPKFSPDGALIETPFPDVSFNGALLPGGAQLDCDGDGVPDDGDGSGILGDMPCLSGELTGCDDNAPLVPNGPAGGSCVAGSILGSACATNDECGRSGTCSDGGTCTAGSVRGEPCLADGECGAGGVCALDQEDGDGDGVGDAADNCAAHANADQADSDRVTFVARPQSIDLVEPEFWVEVGVDLRGGPTAAEVLSRGSCDAAGFPRRTRSLGPSELEEILENDERVCLWRC